MNTIIPKDQVSREFENFSLLKTTTARFQKNSEKTTKYVVIKDGVPVPTHIVSLMIMVQSLIKSKVYTVGEIARAIFKGLDLMTREDYSIGGNKFSIAKLNKWIAQTANTVEGRTLLGEIALSGKTFEDYYKEKVMTGEAITEETVKEEQAILWRSTLRQAIDEYCDNPKLTL